MDESLNEQRRGTRRGRGHRPRGRGRGRGSQASSRENTFGKGMRLPEIPSSDEVRPSLNPLDVNLAGTSNPFQTKLYPTSNIAFSRPSQGTTPLNGIVNDPFTPNPIKSKAFNDVAEEHARNVTPVVTSTSVESQPRSSGSFGVNPFDAARRPSAFSTHINSSNFGFTDPASGPRVSSQPPWSGASTVFARSTNVLVQDNSVAASTFFKTQPTGFVFQNATVSEMENAVTAGLQTQTQVAAEVRPLPLVRTGARENLTNESNRTSASALRTVKTVGRDGTLINDPFAPTYLASGSDMKQPRRIVPNANDSLIYENLPTKDRAAVDTNQEIPSSLKERMKDTLHSNRELHQRQLLVRHIPPALLSERAIFEQFEGTAGVKPTEVSISRSKTGVKKRTALVTFASTGDARLGKINGAFYNSQPLTIDFYQPHGAYGGIAAAASALPINVLKPLTAAPDDGVHAGMHASSDVEIVESNDIDIRSETQNHVSTEAAIKKLQEDIQRIEARKRAFHAQKDNGSASRSVVERRSSLLGSERASQPMLVSTGEEAQSSAKNENISNNGDGWRAGAGKVTLDEAVDFVGKCQEMCPLVEQETRKDISIFEMSAGSDGVMRADPKKMVKKYQRSAAAAEVQGPLQVRPPNVLERTLDYLVSEVMIANAAPFSDRYHFISDRTRCIRQDLTMHGSRFDDASLAILEKSVRFHIMSEHQLCWEDREVFDSKMNLEQLEKCLISVLAIYDMRRERHMDSQNEAEFQAYNIIRFSRPQDINRVCSKFAPEVLHSIEVQFALQAMNCVAYPVNFYAGFFRLARDAPYLVACLMQKKFAMVRLHALDMMNVAMGTSKVPARVSLQDLVDVLGFEDQTYAAEFCEWHGLAVEAGHVLLHSTSLNLHPENVWREHNVDGPIQRKLEGVTLPDIVFGSEKDKYGDKSKLQLRFGPQYIQRRSPFPKLMLSRGASMMLAVCCGDDSVLASLRYELASTESPDVSSDGSDDKVEGQVVNENPFTFDKKLPSDIDSAQTTFTAGTEWLENVSTNPSQRTPDTDPGRDEKLSKKSPGCFGTSAAKNSSFPADVTSHNNLERISAEKRSRVPLESSPGQIFGLMASANRDAIPSRQGGDISLPNTSSVAGNVLLADQKSPRTKRFSPPPSKSIALQSDRHRFVIAGSLSNLSRSQSSVDTDASAPSWKEAQPTVIGDGESNATIVRSPEAVDDLRSKQAVRVLQKLLSDLSDLVTGPYGPAAMEKFMRDCHRVNRADVRLKCRHVLDELSGPIRSRVRSMILEAHALSDVKDEIAVGLRSALFSSARNVFSQIENNFERIRQIGKAASLALSRQHKIPERTDGNSLVTKEGIPQNLRGGNLISDPLRSFSLSVEYDDTFVGNVHVESIVDAVENSMAQYGLRLLQATVLTLLDEPSPSLMWTRALLSRPNDCDALAVSAKEKLSHTMLSVRLMSRHTFAADFASLIIIPLEFSDCFQLETTIRENMLGILRQGRSTNESRRSAPIVIVIANLIRAPTANEMEDMDRHLQLQKLQNENFIDSFCIVPAGLTKSFWNVQDSNYRLQRCISWAIQKLSETVTSKSDYLFLADAATDCANDAWLSTAKGFSYGDISGLENPFKHTLLEVNSAWLRLSESITDEARRLRDDFASVRQDYIRASDVVRKTLYFPGSDLITSDTALEYVRDLILKVFDGGHRGLISDDWRSISHKMFCYCLGQIMFTFVTQRLGNLGSLEVCIPRLPPHRLRSIDAHGITLLSNLGYDLGSRRTPKSAAITGHKRKQELERAHSVPTKRLKAAVVVANSPPISRALVFSPVPRAEFHANKHRDSPTLERESLLQTYVKLCDAYDVAVTNRRRSDRWLESLV